jgi:hypothetical protein
MAGTLTDRPLRIARGFALAAFAAHVLTNSSYGYFRDEIYYLACGEHLAWGYVDHAPMIALFAWIGRHVFGGSMQAIRLLPALSAAGKILLTGLLVREFGGRGFAVALACLSVLFAPIFLAIDSFLSMNTFEPLFWMGAVLVLVRFLNRGERASGKQLIWAGVLLGLGLENKHSTLFFGFALAAGILIAARPLLRQKYLWIAALIAVAILLPNLAWQQAHGWPTIEDLNNVRTSHKNVERPPLAFIGEQLLVLSPVNALVWMAGLGFLLGAPQARRFRMLGWTFLVFFALMMALRGKSYYVAPAYPMMFAAGAVWWESLRPTWPKIALAALITATGAVLAPAVLPVLPVTTLLRYFEWLPVGAPKSEVAHAGPLPQHFGDRFGWPEMTAAVAEMYNALPPEERSRAGILAGNYGEAGAIDLLGAAYGLPKAISAHQSYYLWGSREYTGEVLILLQYSREAAERWCTSYEVGPLIAHPYAMVEEHIHPMVCRGLKVPLAELWPRLKHWN